MLVSHSHKFIFFKTHKTVSTSIECFLEQFCRPIDYNITEKTDMSETEYGIVGARQFGDDIAPKWYAQIEATKIKDQLPEDIWNQYYKISSTRNTYDRLVSWWWWVTDKKTNNSEMMKELANSPFDIIRKRFNTDVQEAKINLAVLKRNEWIVHVGNQLVIDKFIRYEHLQSDMEELCCNLGITIKCVLPKFKTNTRLRSEPFQDYYDNKTIEIVKDMAKWEINYFNYTF